MKNSYAPFMLALLAYAREGRPIVRRVKSVSRRAMSNSGSLAELGGGAINEKERHYGRVEKKDTDNDDVDDAPSEGTWDPTNNLSHMLHAIAGLDRYPNYLVGA